VIAPDSSRSPASPLTGSVGVRGSSPLSSTSISGGCKPLATRGRPSGPLSGPQLDLRFSRDEHGRAEEAGSTGPRIRPEAPRWLRSPRISRYRPGDGSPHDASASVRRAKAVPIRRRRQTPDAPHCDASRHTRRRAEGRAERSRWWVPRRPPERSYRRCVLVEVTTLIYLARGSVTVDRLLVLIRDWRRSARQDHERARRDRKRPAA